MLFLKSFYPDLIEVKTLSLFFSSLKNKACKRKAAEQIYTLSYIMKKQLFLKLYVYTREYVLYYIVLILSNSRLTVFHISE